MTRATRLSASVVTFESDPVLLDRMVASLLESVRRARAARPVEFDLFVVVNDEAPALVARTCELADRWRSSVPDLQLRCLVGHGNVGYGAGQNLAVALATSDYHLVLNPDIVMDEASIDACVSYLETHPEAVMLSPQGYDPHGNYAYLAKRDPSIFVLLLRALAVRPSSGLLGRRVAQYTYARELPAAAPKNVALASGCFMFCRTAALKAVSGFDERYFLYFEDYDLSLRLRSHGEILELPGARIVHHGGHTARRGLRRIGHFARSAINYFAANGWRVY